MSRSVLALRRIIVVVTISAVPLTVLCIERNSSVSAGQAELSDPQRSGNPDRGIFLSVLDRPAGDMLSRAWRLSPRLKCRSAFPRCRLLLMCCRAAILGRRSGLDLRRNVRRRLSSEHERRRHVGRRCRGVVPALVRAGKIDRVRGGDAALVREGKIAVMRDLWHTGAVDDGDQ